MGQDDGYGALIPQTTRISLYAHSSLFLEHYQKHNASGTTWDDFRSAMRDDSKEFVYPLQYVYTRTSNVVQGKVTPALRMGFMDMIRRIRMPYLEDWAPIADPPFMPPSMQGVWKFRVEFGMMNDLPNIFTEVEASRGLLQPAEDAQDWFPERALAHMAVQNATDYLLKGWE